MSRFWHSSVSNIQGYFSVAEAANVHHLPRNLDTVLGQGPVVPPDILFLKQEATIFSSASDELTRSWTGSLPGSRDCRGF